MDDENLVVSYLLSICVCRFYIEYFRVERCLEVYSIPTSARIISQPFKYYMKNQKIAKFNIRFIFGVTSVT